MKTTKFFAMLLMAFSTCMITACSDDDDENGGSGNNDELTEQLQGTWDFKKGTETVMGMKIDFTRAMLEEMKSMMEDAEGVRIEIWDETLVFKGSKVNGVPFKLKGKKFIFDGEDSKEFTVSVKSIDDDEMVLHEEIHIDDKEAGKLDLIADMTYERR